VEADIDVSVPAAGGELLSVRQRLEMHRENPSCAACHNMIDPLGFALENYDLIGRWREESAGNPVDASARLWDGTELTGSDGLRRALLERKKLFVETFTEKLMTYALGRVLTYSDMPRVREIVAEAATDDYRFASIVKGIIESDAFQYRIKVVEPVQVAQH
jgi:hypothetical protein